MILINLLPQHLRPLKRTPLPYIGVFIVMLAAFFVMASMFLSVSAQIGEINQKKAKTQNSLNELADVVKRYEDLDKKKARLVDKTIAIEEILKDRILWSEQLFHLDRLKPDNMWYSRIRVTQLPFKQRVRKVDPKTKKAMKDKNGKDLWENKTIKRPVLEVSGYVVPSEEESNYIAPLTRSTTEDPDFSKLFTLYRFRLEDTVFNDQPVRKFVLEYVIEPSKKDGDAPSEGGKKPAQPKGKA